MAHLPEGGSPGSASPAEKQDTKGIKEVAAPLHRGERGDCEDKKWRVGAWPDLAGAADFMDAAILHVQDAVT